MILPSLLVAFVLVSGLLLALFRSLPSSSIWKAALLISLGVGIARVVSSLAGRLVLMNVSNWLQIPALAMALTSLPEAALVPQLQKSSMASAFLLGLTLIAGTSIWVFSIAAVAYARKR